MASVMKRIQSNLQLRLSGAERLDDDVENLDGSPDKTGRTRAIAELKLQVKLAAPVVLGYLLQMMLNLIVIFFVGHASGAHELAAVSLANMYVGVTGLSVTYGLATAMDTLCAQEVGRNPDSALVGVYLQRGMAVILSFFPFIAVLWCFTEPILVFLRQDEDIARLAGYYTLVLIPGLPFVMVFECLKKYLQSQSIMAPIFYAMLVASVIDILMCWALVNGAGMGLHGAPIALVFAWASLPIFLGIFIKVRGLHKRTWGGWSREAFKEWGTFFKYALPGMVMLCNEWWAFEIVALAAGILGEIQLASQTIVLTTSSIMFMVPFGVGVAVNVRVGNLLGAGLPSPAKLSSKVGLAIGVFVTSIEAVLLIAMRHVWGYVFTTDEAVVELVASLLLICAAFQLLDGLQGVLAGVVRGLGKQKYGAIANFAAFYVVGIPAGLALAFPGGQDVHGLWWGLCISLFCCVIAYGIICVKVPWVAEGAQEEIAMHQLLVNDDDDDEVDYDDEYTERLKGDGGQARSNSQEEVDHVMHVDAYFDMDEDDAL